MIYSLYKNLINKSTKKKIKSVQNISTEDNKFTETYSYQYLYMVK